MRCETLGRGVERVRMHGFNLFHLALCSALVLSCVPSAVILAADAGGNGRLHSVQIPQGQGVPDTPRWRRIIPRLQASGDFLWASLMQLSTVPEGLIQDSWNSFENSFRRMRIEDCAVGAEEAGQRARPVVTLELPSLLKLLPQDLVPIIVDHFSLVDYFLTLPNLKEMQQNPWPFLGEALGMLRQSPGVGEDGLVEAFVDEVVSMVQQALQQGKQEIRGMTLNKFICWGFSVAEKGGQPDVEAYCRALVADKRLEAIFWNGYGNGIIMDAVNGDIAVKTAKRMLRTLIKAGSIDVAVGIHLCDLDDKYKAFRAAHNDIQNIVWAAINYVEFWEGIYFEDYGRVKTCLNRSKKNPAKHGEIDLIVALQLAARGGHRQVFAHLLGENGTKPEVYGDVNSIAFEYLMSYWASREC